MKYLLVLILLCTLSAKANDEDLMTLLCHKWRAVEMVAGKKSLPVASDGDYTIFRKDFTCQQKQDEHIEDGTWKYVAADKKIIYDSGDEVIVKELTATKLVLIIEMDGMQVDVIFKRFEN